MRFDDLRLLECFARFPHVGLRHRKQNVTIAAIAVELPTHCGWPREGVDFRISGLVNQARLFQDAGCRSDLCEKRRLRSFLVNLIPYIMSEQVKVRYLDLPTIGIRKRSLCRNRDEAQQ